MTNPIVFVHIPKTAGTSFRASLERFYGVQKICFDYGLQSPQTTDIVKDLIYENNDFWSFYQSFCDRKYQVLSGHFEAEKFIPLFGVRSMYSFVREPIERIVSEFNHICTHYNYTKSFETFALSKSETNKQSRFLASLPWPAMRFIGLTEQYSESLDLLAKETGMKLELESKNKGSYKNKLEVPCELKAKLLRANQRDFEFYTAVKVFFNHKLDAYRSKQRFTTGMLQSIKRNIISGWAFYADSPHPPHISLLKNGKTLVTMEAKQYRPRLHQYGLPRSGYVGFAFKDEHLRDGDIIEAKDAETAQPLAFSGRIFCEKN